LIEVETRGGLGDVFITMHETDAYESICSMGPRDEALVTIISHNPFADEIFKWHPLKDRIQIVKSKFFFHEYSDRQIRRNAGVCEVAPAARPRRARNPIPFFSSPEDEKVLASLLPKTPYLAVAPTSSGMEVENRSLPPAIIETAFAASRRRNIPIVLLGRNYQGPHAFKPGFTGPTQNGIVDMIDKLSVPGTAQVVKRAAAVLSAHSALLLLSWYERRPTFAAYPPKYYHHDFSNPISPFVFGKDYPTTDHMQFKDYTPARFDSFLSRYFK
jgi:hypothetical protein